MSTLRHAVIEVLKRITVETDPALDWDAPMEDCEIMILWMHHEIAGFAAASIPQCNITNQEDFLRRVFEPMIASIRTEQKQQVVN